MNLHENQKPMYLNSSSTFPNPGSSNGASVSFLSSSSSSSFALLRHRARTEAP